MIQGIFVGHHDRTGVVLCINERGVMRAKELYTTTTGTCCGPRKLGRSMRNSVPDGGSGKENQGRQRRSGSSIAEDDRGQNSRGYVLSADIDTHVRIGDRPGCTAMITRRRTNRTHNDERRETSERWLRGGWRSKASMDASKERLAECQKARHRVIEKHSMH